MDGGSRVAEVLRRQGVPYVFTLVGGHVSPILVACKQRGIRVVDVRDEATAAFAADATARLTGVPGVAVVTAGPGVTNTITALKNAQLAGSPLVLIGGATATMLRGRGALQDIDQLALVRPHVKWMARPNRLRDVIPALEQAFEKAQEGVPGPVFVELAIDLLYPEAVVREWYAKKTDKADKSLVEHATSLYVRGHLRYVFGRSADPTFHLPPPLRPAAPRRADVEEAARRIGRAERPVLVIGSQAVLRPAQAARLVEAIERIGAPVYLSGMARGLLGRGHPLQMRHARRQALREADLAVLAGVPADFRLDYGAHLARCEVVGINLSAADLYRNRKPDLALRADPHTALVQIGQHTGQPPSREAWLGRLRARDRERDAEIAALADQPTDHLNPLELCRRIEAWLPERSVLVGDGGDFVASASYVVSPRAPLTWLDPGVFGTLGVGAGFALGAKLARPDHEVVLLYGDGAAGFSILEFDTLVRHRLPVVAIVGNDAGWTQIERDQVAILGDDVACRLASTDYHVVAAGCGAVGLILDDPAKTDRVLAEALEHARAGRPVLVNARIGRTRFREGSISM